MDALTYPHQRRNWFRRALTRFEFEQDFVERLMVLHEDPHPSVFMLLCNFRSTAFWIKYSSEDPSHRGLGFLEYHKLIASDPLGFLAYSHCAHCPQVEHNPEADWYSDYQHRMLCLIGVFIFIFSHASTLGTLDPPIKNLSNQYLTHAIEQVEDLARNVIEKSDPNTAKLILASLPAMLKQLGFSK